jgi:ribonuclease P/MRP protein subunit RPP40
MVALIDLDTSIKNIQAWLKNFLCSRTHATRVGNCMSRESHLLSGVIQGSVIGPLLFISYINELAEIFGHCKVTVKFFADDLKIYAEISTDFDADMYQFALDTLSDWANKWQLQISIVKCFVMHIGAPPLRETYSLDGQALP